MPLYTVTKGLAKKILDLSEQIHDELIFTIHSVGRTDWLFMVQRYLFINTRLMMLLYDERCTSVVGLRLVYLWFGNLCWAA